MEGEGGNFVLFLFLCKYWTLYSFVERGKTLLGLTFSQTKERIVSVRRLGLPLSDVLVFVLQEFINIAFFFLSFFYFLLITFLH